MSARLGTRPDLGSAIAARPSFGLYLAALAVLPFRWLSPLAEVSSRSTWTDVLVALAVVTWAWERARSGRLVPGSALRPFYLALAVFVALTALSGVFADDRRDAVINVAVTAELVALAVLTGDYARGRRERDAIVVVVMLGALATAALALAGLALFYAGEDTGLIGVYGEQFIASDSYARVAAGFGSPPLLAGYCIFAAAVMAIDSDLAPRARRATEAALAIVVVLTLSRAIIGFFGAVGIRAAAARRSSRARTLAWVAAVLGVGVMVALTVGRLHLDPTRPSTISYEVPDPGNRREAFATSLETLGERPILGAGPGTLTGENRGLPFRAHFTPLNVAATVGVPALAALSAALLLLWMGRPRPTEVAIWSGLAGVGIDAIGQDVEHFRHVWVLIGLAAAPVATAADGDEGGD